MSSLLKIRKCRTLSLRNNQSSRRINLRKSKKKPSNKCIGLSKANQKRHQVPNQWCKTTRTQLTRKIREIANPVSKMTRRLQNSTSQPKSTMQQKKGRRSQDAQPQKNKENKKKTSSLRINRLRDRSETKDMSRRKLTLTSTGKIHIKFRSRIIEVSLCSLQNHKQSSRLKSKGARSTDHVSQSSTLHS